MLGLGETGRTARETLWLDIASHEDRCALTAVVLVMNSKG